MSVRDFCSQTLHTIRATNSVQEGAQRMLEHHVGTLVVVDDSSRATGVMTDRDIVTRCVAREFDPRVMTVAEVMTEPAQTVDEESTIENALRLMADEEIRRVVVTTRGGRVTGLLSLDDVVARLSVSAAEIERLLRGQVRASSRTAAIGAAPKPTAEIGA